MLQPCRSAAFNENKKVHNCRQIQRFIKKNIIEQLYPEAGGTNNGAGT